MKLHPCCVRRNTNRRAAGLAGAILSGIPLVLMPKCPLCFATYITLLTGVSVSATTAGQLRVGVITLSIGVAGTMVVICLVRIQRRWKRGH